MDKPWKHVELQPERHENKFATNPEAEREREQIFFLAVPPPPATLFVALLNFLRGIVHSAF